jgi:hypothetical protein
VSGDKIIARIVRELGEGGDPLERLARELAPTDLQSLMLHVYRERSARRAPAELLAQYARSTLVQPSTVDGRRIRELEEIAFAAARAFEALELAPVAPLGLNRVLGEIDQNNCLATVRLTEVLADPTTVKALECARRRRAGTTGTIRLCARSRPLRLQPFDTPGFAPHFGLFSLVSAGRDRGALAFELESLREHIGVYLAALGALQAAGFRLGTVEVAVSDTERDARRLERVQRELFEPLASELDGGAVMLAIDRQREHGIHYYRGLCFSIDATDAGGQRVNLADGGFTDWTQRLLSDAKERLLVSGVGLEIIPKRFTRVNQHDRP